MTAALRRAGQGRTRVLWLVKGLGPGGAERLLVEHARGADPRRVRPTRSPTSSSEDAPRCRARGVRRARRTRSTSTASSTRGGSSACAASSRAAATTSCTRTRRSRPARRASSSARCHARRVPAFVYTEHNRWQSHNALTRVGEPGDVRVERRDVRGVGRRPRRRSTRGTAPTVEVLTHGIDLDAVRAHTADRAAVRAELGVDDGTQLAVTVANLRATKNYPGLLAAARVVADRGLPVRFAAAGQGPLEAEVAAEHARLGLGDTFRLLGYRTDATRLIAAADVFVLASAPRGPAGHRDGGARPRRAGGRPGGRRAPRGGAHRRERHPRRPRATPSRSPTRSSGRSPSPSTPVSSPGRAPTVRASPTRPRSRASSRPTGTSPSGAERRSRSRGSRSRARSAVADQNSALREPSPSPGTRAM